ncbi:hypothetical protein BJ322DRAFT_1163854 [Thelephora terrestris]|uniref:Uncharacterized protein n=1 Tax=Thelephora terrestris TaxID=56493 RepID=A0A9P6H7U8_9AGAM|nr:hypothetical protein BJ322DRAFT_1163854 [Thelephora terrestris]
MRPNDSSTHSVHQLTEDPKEMEYDPCIPTPSSSTPSPRAGSRHEATATPTPTPCLAQLRGHGKSYSNVHPLRSSKSTSVLRNDPSMTMKARPTSDYRNSKLSPSSRTLSSVTARSYLSCHRHHVLHLNERQLRPNSVPNQRNGLQNLDTSSQSPSTLTGSSTTSSHPVFHNVNDLAAHHGIPMSLPPTLRTVTRRDPQTKPSDDFLTSPMDESPFDDFLSTPALGGDFQDFASPLIFESDDAGAPYHNTPLFDDLGLFEPPSSSDKRTAQHLSSAVDLHRMHTVCPGTPALDASSFFPPSHRLPFHLPTGRYLHLF